MSFELQDGVLRWAPWRRFDWLRHGFSTRELGDPREPEGEEALRRLSDDDARLVRVKQTHSATVVRAEEAAGADPPVEADALTACSPGLLPAVLTADCAPLLIVDPAGRGVAAVHAGWRGTAARIAQAAVAALVRETGGEAADFAALIGPSISCERFEVGEEVAARFPAEAVRRRPEWPRPHVDLEAANRLQLVAAGLRPENIGGGGLCTWDRADWFPSYRRDGAATGRIAAAVGIVGS